MLTRFLTAQNQHPYSRVLQELQNGRKSGHWIWYFFPQLKGMGTSYNSTYYGLDGLDEAREYWTEPVLGARLRECCGALLEHDHRDIEYIMGGELDAMKLRSSMTLFRLAAPEEPIFQEVLHTFFQDDHCPKTYRLLGIGQ